MQFFVFIILFSSLCGQALTVFLDFEIVVVDEKWKKNVQRKAELAEDFLQYRQCLERVEKEIGEEKRIKVRLSANLSCSNTEQS